MSDDKQPIITVGMFPVTHNRIPLNMKMGDDGIVVMSVKKAKRVRTVYLYRDPAEAGSFVAENGVTIRYVGEKRYGVMDYRIEGDTRVPVEFDPAIVFESVMGIEWHAVKEVPPDAIECDTYVIEFE